MTAITFIIPGNPMGKQRPRFANGHAYTPSETKAQELLIATRYRQYGGEMMQGSIGVDIVAVMSIPKSWGERRRRNTLGRYAVCKPDADNITKLVLDALNGVAWSDDKAVVEVHVWKVYGEIAQTKVTVRTAEEEWRDAV